ncbi:MAG: CreA family protein [Magnetococcales bacterium]|nr:CreA family protein [Magnetococcales bacterium]
MKRFLKIFWLFLLFPAVAHGEEIGSVSTVFKLLGSNDKIVIEAFDDPKISGVSCHLSRAKKGGISGSVGLAEDPSNSAIACRQVGPIHFQEELKEGEEVFSKSTSILFKNLHVVRFFDQKRHTLVYLIYSDRLVDGSPKNSISTVPIMPWKN